MTARAMKTAGWLAMISAFVTIPLVYLLFRLGDRTDTVAIFIQTILQITGTLLYVAITLYLKKLLNRRFNFYDTNKSIDLLIKVSVIAGLITVLSLQFTTLKESIGMVAIVLLVVQGVALLQFGYKLLKLQNNLGGMLKPYCYTNMVSGIMMASVLFILAGVVVSAIADLMLGTIFFHLARQGNEQT